MMKEKKIVIIRGKVTAGKTITSHKLAEVLPGWILIDPWKIKEMFEPLGLKNREPMKRASKKAMIEIMRIVLKELGINIIVQETTLKFIRKYLKNDLKKHNYKLYSFYLNVNYEDALKRDKQREKPTMFLGKDIKNEEQWKISKAQKERGDFEINTSDYSTKEVVKIILNQINEKARKNPNAWMIRKCW